MGALTRQDWCILLGMDLELLGCQMTLNMDRELASIFIHEIKHLPSWHRGMGGTLQSAVRSPLRTIHSYADCPVQEPLVWQLSL